MQNGHDANTHTLHPTDNGICHPSWLKFIPQTSLDTYYSPRYSILKFPPERTMVNALLHRCCAARIGSSRKIRPLWLYKTVYCYPGFEHRTWIGGFRRCTARPLRLRVWRFCEYVTARARFGLYGYSTNPVKYSFKAWGASQQSKSLAGDT